MPDVVTVFPPALPIETFLKCYQCRCPALLACEERSLPSLARQHRGPRTAHRPAPGLDLGVQLLQLGAVAAGQEKVEYPELRVRDNLGDDDRRRGEPGLHLARRDGGQIGRASCRERVWISVVAVAVREKR